MKATLLIPTLNEVNGLRKIMPQINRSWVDQILIVDGNSTDGTIEYLKENNFEYYIQKNPGLRNAYFEVWDKIENEIIITFSPDGNCLPDKIPLIIKEMEKGYDLVICSRYKDNAKSEDDDWITSFGNWFFTKTVNVLLKGNYTDVMGIFRAFRRDTIYRLHLLDGFSYKFVENLFFTKISWEPLLSARAARYKLKISEISGDEPKRIGGQRKLQILRWGAAYYTQFLIEYIKSFYLKITPR